MEELSIEEKAKAYDEAIRVLHKYDGANIMFSQSLKEEMFPELKENKDEKIRKAIINVFASHKDYENFYGVSVEDILVWLEKQDAQTIKEALRTEYEKGWYDMREEMMKDAVDGEVIEVLDDDCSICGHAHLELFFDQYTLLENFKDGDKVKLIIVKED